MSDLRTFTLWARELLTKEAGDQLQQIYRLDATTGARLAIPKGHALETSNAVQENRERIERLLDDEMDAGLTRTSAVTKLLKETAFTHLNRFVAFQLLAARGLVRSPLAKYHAANGFKMWLSVNADAETLYNQGDSPSDRDEFGEAPRDRAYREFLLWQCAELAKEIRVLFDPDNLPSLLFPRPAELRKLIDALNTDERTGDWEEGNEETIGWVYQYFNEPDLLQFRGQSTKQVPPELVGPRTQNYTPRWVVRLLVENTIGRLWLSMHPDSKLREELAYLVPLADGARSTELRHVRDIHVLDPATGTMHFGLVAFDLLAKMYREELANVGMPGWPKVASVSSDDEIPGSILSQNIFGIDIDLRAVQLAALVLYLRAKQFSKNAIVTDVNLACADVKLFRGQHLDKIADQMALPKSITRDLFRQFCESLDNASQMGTLVRLEKHFERFNAEELRTAIDLYAGKNDSERYFVNESTKGLRLLDMVSRRYDVILTNPPYLDNRDYNPSLKKFITENYKDTSRNLYSAMMRRCIELLAPEGRLGILTGQSFMFISSFEKLRTLYANAGAIECMAHFDYGLFEARVDTTAFVLRREQLEMERRGARGVYFRLVKEPDAESKRNAFEQALARRRAGQPESRVYEYQQGNFAAIPASPWAYWASKSTRELFTDWPSLSEVAKPWVGLQTSANPRFLRYWWEVGVGLIALRAQTEEEALNSGKRWFPHMKGGAFKRWYGNQSFVVDWGENAKVMKAFAEDLKFRVKSPPGNGPLRPFPYYFREGITWTHTTPKGLNARFMPAGFICNVEGMACYPESSIAPVVLALLNSAFASYLVNHLNGTIHFGATEVGNIPWPLDLTAQARTEVSRRVARLIDLGREDSEIDENTFDFVCPTSWSAGEERISDRIRERESLERDLDELVFGMFNVGGKEREIIDEELTRPPDAVAENEIEAESDADEDAIPAESNKAQQLSASWVSYAVGIALGRFVPGRAHGLGRGCFSPEVNQTLQQLIDADGLMVVQRDHPDDLPQRVLDILAVIHSDVESARIVRTALGGNGDLRDSLATYLLGPFFKAHVRQYCKRPVYWLLQSPRQSYSVYLFHERATDQTLSLLQGTKYLGGRLFQLKQLADDANLKAEKAEGREKAIWKRKAQDAAEVWSDADALRKAIEDTNAEPITTADGLPASAHWVPEFDDGVLLNAAPLYRLTPAWKRADPKLDLRKTWDLLKVGEYPWAKTAMRYWPRETRVACKENKSYRIAHGLE